MKTTLKYALMLTLLIGLVSLTACGDDDDNGTGTNPNPTTDIWVGVWESIEGDVAPLLVAVYDYDTVRVTFNENNTVLLETHVRDGAWGTQSGTYQVTESASSDIDAIVVDYPGSYQEGIVQFWSASPDSMWLEVVQTVPDLGSAPRTPASGFGSDPGLGAFNIQKYRKAN